MILKVAQKEKRKEKKRQRKKKRKPGGKSYKEQVANKEFRNIPGYVAVMLQQLS